MCSGKIQAVHYASTIVFKQYTMQDDVGMDKNIGLISNFLGFNYCFGGICTLNSKLTTVGLFCVFTRDKLKKEKFRF